VSLWLGRGVCSTPATFGQFTQSAPGVKVSYVVSEFDTRDQIRGEWLRIL